MDQEKFKSDCMISLLNQQIEILESLKKMAVKEVESGKKMAVKEVESGKLAKKENGSVKFEMEMEPHTPKNMARPCKECVLSVPPMLCLDRKYCRFRETGKTWTKKLALNEEAKNGSG